MNDDDGITPTGLVVAASRWMWVTILAGVILAVIVIGGWQVGWWFAGQNANRQAHVIRQGFSNQQTLRDQITQRIGEVGQETVSIAQAAGNPAEVSALKDQRIDTINTACQAAGEVTGDPLPTDQQAWARANCLAGVIRPGSKYDNDNGGTQ